MIAPSILSADFGCLQSEIDKVSNAEYLHFDVMDGHFVPNLTVGPVVLKSLKTKMFKDVHLMITNPLDFVESFSKAGADGITFHAEVCKDCSDEIIEKIKANGCKVGVALNPDSDLGLIESYLDKVDMVLLMTVFPGFGGQEFIVDVLDKIRKLREIAPEIDIQVDGGINYDTIKLAKEAGANVFVSGSFIFGSEEPAKVVDELKKKCE